jgi:uncharacterized protein (DUF2235 family)
LPNAVSSNSILPVAGTNANMKAIHRIAIPETKDIVSIDQKMTINWQGSFISISSIGHLNDRIGGIALADQKKPPRTIDVQDSAGTVISAKVSHRAFSVLPMSNWFASPTAGD